ncbi:hypothetical protein RJ640_020113 [Escallonia rubra]|uniref:Retrotransposon Copia-like N-terminal domain-containing protein n=1 Tax=Escallonia rubra TaxID=112253 RepID=A0AA88UF18_9ASTE|nr:hypothetical protein RJ640_020113 [Escallonia rubra]
MEKWVLDLKEYSVTYIPQKVVKRQVLADFLADNPSNEIEKGIIYVGIIPWKMMFDGSKTSQEAGAGIPHSNRPSRHRTLKSRILLCWCVSNLTTPLLSQQSLPTHPIRPTIKERCVPIFIDMAKDAETSKPKHLDPTSEYYLFSQANSGNSLTKDTLKGDNYVAWEQSAILTLKSHNKLAFIDGRIAKPDPKSKDFLAWDIFNSTLCSWICNSLDPIIRATTYQFLMGLDDKYATSRTQIINIDRVYAMVMQEESHRGITGSRDTNLVVGFHPRNRPPIARSSGLVSATAGDPDHTPTGWP